MNVQQYTDKLHLAYAAAAALLILQHLWASTAPPIFAELAGWLPRVLLFGLIVIQQQQQHTKVSKQPSQSNHKRRQEAPHAACAAMKDSKPLVASPMIASCNAAALECSKGIASCRSTSKTVSSNSWIPTPSTALAGSTNNHGAGNGSSGGKGQGGSKAAPSGGRSSSRGSRAGTAGGSHAQNSSVSSGGRGGGGCDDSDEGEGDERPRFQLVKSHSLETEDPASKLVDPPSTIVDEAANPTDSSSALEPKRRKGHSSARSSKPGSSSSGSGSSGAEQPAGYARPLAGTGNPGSASPFTAATTGPWKLASPFAGALSPFSSDSSTASGRLDQAVAATPALTATPQPAAVTATPKQQQQQQAPSQPEAGGVGAAAAAASSSSANSATVTGPWKLASPFAAAAPLPAFSAAAPLAHDTVEAVGAAGGAAGASHATAQATEGLRATTAQTSSPAGASDKQGNMRTKQQQAMAPKPPRSRRAAARPAEGQGTSSRGTTGPWALHSPFAAAGASSSPSFTDSDEDAAVQAPEVVAASSSQAAKPRSSYKAVGQFPASDVALANQLVGAAMDPFGSPISAISHDSTVSTGVVGSGDTIGSGSREAAAAATDTRHPSQGKAVGGTTKQTQAATVAPAAAPTASGAVRTGPWGLFSPFAAAVPGFEDLPSSSDEAPQQQHTATPPTLAIEHVESCAIESTSRGQQAGIGAGAPTTTPPSNTSSSSVLAGAAGGSDEVVTLLPSSVQAAPELRYSSPFSMVSDGMSAGASSSTMASSSNAAHLELGEQLSLLPTPNNSLRPGEALSPLPDGSPLHSAEEGKCGKQSGLQTTRTADAPSGDMGCIGAIGMQRSASLAPSRFSGQQQQQTGMQGRHRKQGAGLTRVGPLHDSVTSHLLKHKMPATTVMASSTADAVHKPDQQQQAQHQLLPVTDAAATPAAAEAAGTPLVAVQAVPADLPPLQVSGQDAVAQARSLEAPAMVVLTDPVAAAATVQRPISVASATATVAAADPSILAASAGIKLAGSQPGTPTTTSAPGTPVSAAADTAAGRQSALSLPLTTAGSAGVVKPASLSCLCCYPPCLTEGQASEAHLYVLGLDQAIAQCPVGTVETYRVVAFHGSAAVADVRGVCRAGEGLFRVPLPGLPKGVLQLGVLLNEHHLCFVQPLLVLPAPCAHEMVLLWASLLQARLTAAGQQQRRQQQQRQQEMTTPAARRESLDGSSNWTSQDSSCSRTSSAASEPSDTTGSVEVAAGASKAAGGQADAQQPRAGQGQGSGLVSPMEVQAVWQQQYLPVITDIAYLLVAQLQKAAASGSTGPSSLGLGGGATASADVSIDAPEFKALVTHLVQFLAANGMWAVLQLITDSVYGVGASAKALYTAKAASSSTQAKGSSSGIPTTGTGEVTPPSNRSMAGGSVAGSVGGSSEANTFSSSSARSLPASAAVRAALAAVEAGEVPDLRAVGLLLLLSLKVTLACRAAACQSAFAAAGHAVVHDPLAAVVGVGKGLLWLLFGIAWLVGYLVQLPQQLVGGLLGGEEIEGQQGE